MGRRAMVLLPGALALFLSALMSGVAADPVVPHSDPAAATDPFPPVPGLRPQVEFWIDVFTQLRQNEVLLHDTQFPRLRYEVFTLPGTVDAGLSRDQVSFLDARKQRLAAQLETLEIKLGRGEPLSPSEQELQRRLEAAGGRDAVHDAAQRVRSQRGLRERFLAGVRRSGRYMAQMRRIFAEEKLPPDLAYLPHVESSFNIEARSTAGAAGIWQFTRPTGRRYLHVSDALDERLDPIKETGISQIQLRILRVYPHALWEMQILEVPLRDIVLILKNQWPRKHTENTEYLQMISMSSVDSVAIYHDFDLSKRHSGLNRKRTAMIYLSGAGCTVHRYNRDDAHHAVTVMTCLLECRRSAPVTARRNNRRRQEHTRITHEPGNDYGRVCDGALAGSDRTDSIHNVTRRHCC